MLTMHRSTSGLPLPYCPAEVRVCLLCMTHMSLSLCLASWTLQYICQSLTTHGHTPPPHSPVHPICKVIFNNACGIHTFCLHYFLEVLSKHYRPQIFRTAGFWYHNVLSSCRTLLCVSMSLPQACHRPVRCSRSSRPYGARKDGPRRLCLQYAH